MARRSVAIRLGTEGKEQVKNDFAEIEQAGGASAARLRQRYERETEAIAAATSRAARTAQQMAANDSGAPTGIQQRINAAVGIGGGAGGARESAAFFAEMEDRARRLLSVIDPLWTAQQRVNAEIAEARTLFASGAISADQLAMAERRAKEAAEGLALAHARGGQSVGALRAGTQQLSYQIGDVSQQLAMGVNPAVVFGQQIGQVTQAVSLMTNKTTGFIGFLAGPWGAVLTGAITVLGLLYSKMGQTEEQSGRNVRAADLHRLSLQALTRTIREQTEALRERLRTSQQVEQAEIREATATMAQVRERRNANVREQAEAVRALEEAQERVNRATGPQAELARGELARLQARLDRLRREQSTLQGDEDTAAARLRLAETEAADRRVDERLDRETAANGRLERSLAALREERGREAISSEEYERRRQRLIEANRRELESIRREEEAARDRQRSETREAAWTSFVMPVSGAIRSGFGPRRGRRHEGIDIAVPVGTPVRAAAAGSVSVRSDPSGYGTYVVLEHGGGTTSLYAHLSRVFVGDGDSVEQGQVIALSGGARGAPGAGNSEGPHVHHEVRRGGRAVNPTAGRFPTNRDQVVRAAESSAERIRREVAELRRELDPAAAAAEEFADRVARIQQLVANPEAGVSAEQGQAMRFRAGADYLGSVLDGLDEIEQAEQEAIRRRDQMREQLADMGADADDRLTLLRAELGLGGLNERQRQSTLRLIEMELDLNRRFGPEYAEQVRGILEKARAEQALLDQIEEVRRAQEEIERIGSNLIDEVFNPDNWDDWGEAGKRIIRMLLNELLVLAAINPLKNMLFGQNNATIGTVFKALGAIGGSIGGGGGGGFGDILGAASKLAPGAFASGTHNAPGGLAWLAENGPELVFLPRGSKVTPAADTRRLLAANDGGPGVSLTFNNDFRGADPSVVARVEAEQQRLREELPSLMMKTWYEDRQRQHQL